MGKSKAGAYGDFIVELDHHIGKLLDKLVELDMGIRQDVWRKNKNLDKLKKVICTFHKELTNEHGFRGVKSALINFCAEKAKAVNKLKQN